MGHNSQKSTLVCILRNVTRRSGILGERFLPTHSSNISHVPHLRCWLPELSICDMFPCVPFVTHPKQHRACCWALHAQPLMINSIEHVSDWITGPVAQILPEYDALLREVWINSDVSVNLQEFWLCVCCHCGWSLDHYAARMFPPTNFNNVMVLYRHQLVRSVARRLYIDLPNLKGFSFLFFLKYAYSFSWDIAAEIDNTNPSYLYSIRVLVPFFQHHILDRFFYQAQWGLLLQEPSDLVLSAVGSHFSHRKI